MATKIKRYYKTASGNYRARVSLNGKRIGKTFKRVTEAKNWIAEMISKLNTK